MLVRLTDRPNMTIAVYRESKTTIQQIYEVLKVQANRQAPKKRSKSNSKSKIANKQQDRNGNMQFGLLKILKIKYRQN